MQNGQSIEKKEVYLVTWKKQDGHTEIFGSLSVLIKSYPAHGFEELEKTLAFGRSVFENEDVRIEKKAIVTIPKPDFPRVFFWDFNYDKLDWKENYVMVIQRILERGMPEHWQELERFYGKETITLALREKVSFLPDECIDEASSFFNIKKEEMLCYKRKQSQPKLWL
jgi:hypothetical protein